MIVTVATVEGTIEGACWFQYDLADDILYLRLEAFRDAPTAGEEAARGVRLLRHAETGQPVGLSVFRWWEQHGSGAPPDSLAALCDQVAVWAGRLLPDPSAPKS
jgi:hypothetical protein